MKWLPVWLIFLSWSLQAQIGRVEANEFANQLTQRYEILYGNYPAVIGNGVLFRSDVDSFFRKIDLLENTNTSYPWASTYIHREIPEFQNTNTAEEQDGFVDINEPPRKKKFLQYFYDNPAYLWSLKKEKFWLGINPGVYAFGAKELEKEYIIQNTRAAKVKGTIGKRLYFASNIYENQVAFPSYHNDRIEEFKTIPGNAFYKNYRFPIFDQQRGYDFLNADGYAGVRVDDFLNFEIGHGTHHIGYGDRSLLLSNYATNYFFLRANTRIWKFNYQNIFKELAPLSTQLVTGDSYIPKKYSASHLLSYRFTESFEMAIFEHVVFSREDHFEFQYLNPIILYRSVEQLLNSSDNVVIGLQAKLNLFRKIQLYGQVLIDELNYNIIREDRSWWGNKIGGQIGVKYVNVLGIDFLDLQVELNAIRPFTYTHNRYMEDYEITTANYSHHSQPLAHPLGNNLRELIVKLDYMPIENLFINARLVYTQAGLDTDDRFVGQNILRSSLERTEQFGFNFLAGEPLNMLLFNGKVSYMFWHNYFIDFIAQYRRANTTIDYLSNESVYVGLGLRINVAPPNYDY